jgi:hypothetical protein
VGDQPSAHSVRDIRLDAKSDEAANESRKSHSCSGARPLVVTKECANPRATSSLRAVRAQAHSIWGSGRATTGCGAMTNDAIIDGEAFSPPETQGARRTEPQTGRSLQPAPGLGARARPAIIVELTRSNLLHSSRTGFLETEPPGAANFSCFQSVVHGDRWASVPQACGPHTRREGAPKRPAVALFNPFAI